MERKSGIYLEKITEIQSDVAIAIAKLMRANDCQSGMDVSTNRERYHVKVSGKNGSILLISDGMDDLTEYKIDVVELTAILESLEDNFKIYA